MGLGKQLVGQSSYGASQMNSSLRIQSHGAMSSAIGARGTVGWQAPEVMVLRGNADSSMKSENSNRLDGGDSTESHSLNECNGRTSRSVDIFSLGCVFYTTLVPGSHPFGEWYEREGNIMHNRIDMHPLRSISMEAYDLIGLMLNRNPKLRPTAKDVCEHPFFWEQDRKMSFLCDVSDRIETDGVSEQLSSLSLLVERNASTVIGLDWSQELDEDLVSNVQRFRSYNTSSVRDVLRLIRNKHHHFEELSSKLKESFGSSVGLMSYFEIKFPKLLIHIYNVVRDSIVSDDIIVRKYTIKSNLKHKENIVPCSEDDMKEMSLAWSMANQDILSPLLEIDVVDVSVEHQDLVVDSKLKHFSVKEKSPLLVKLESSGSNSYDTNDESKAPVAFTDIINASTTRKTNENVPIVYHQGWYSHEDDWISGVSKRLDQSLLRCLDDNKFRTRLCNHWDLSFGTVCPLRKKNKCIFAHGPIELRVKEGKRTRWGKLVDADGNCKNPNHSGGEDTYGAARSIESERKDEGKWNNKNANNLGKKKNMGKSKKSSASAGSNGTSHC
jgi:serine/threonine-protein kinase/endoribonuclease IRE1